MLQFRRIQGFTLYELLITLALASVITSLAVPGFRGFVQSSRAVTHTNDLITALNLGRSEATRRSAPIDLCASSDGIICSNSTDWSDGWIVLTPAGEVLRTWPARSGGSGILTGPASTIRFQARGVAIAGPAPQLALQLSNCNDDNNNRREISINVAGRISVNRVDCQ